MLVPSRIYRCLPDVSKMCPRLYERTRSNNNKGIFVYYYTSRLTYLLTPWSRALLEKLASLQLVKKFPAFYGTRRFLTAPTSARHLSLSDSRFYHGNFSLQGKISVVTMVWVVSRFRLKAPPGISSSCISPLTSWGQHSRTSWASQPQKSATLSPQPGGKPRKFIRTCGSTEKKKWLYERACLSSLSTWNRPPAVREGCRVSYKQMRSGDRFVLPLVSRTKTLLFRK